METCVYEVRLKSEQGRPFRGNLVPRVSHLTAQGGKMRDPGNEVDFGVGPEIRSYARVGMHSWNKNQPNSPGGGGYSLIWAI